MKTPTTWLRNSLDLDPVTRKGIEDHPLLPTLDDCYYDGEFSSDVYLSHVKRMIDDVHAIRTVIKMNDEQIETINLVALAGEIC